MNLKNSIEEQTYKDFIYIKKILSNHTKRAYIVGGASRDLFLGNRIEDLDIEVYDIPFEKFSSLMKKIGAKGVGKSFFVYKYNNIDISLPRVENKVGVGHKAFSVSIVGDEKEASKRRDFTINAIMQNIFTAKILDFWGGVDDIKKKILRVVDPEKFSEDSLRVLRAMQFCARFGFKCEKNSIEIMQNIDLSDLSKERIFWEFEKLFKGKYLQFGFYYLFRLKIAKKLFNIDTECKEFIKIAKIFIKYQDNFEKEYRKYYFLYVLSKFLNIDINHFLQILNAPKEYERFYKLQPATEGKIDDKTILQIALNIPIKMCLENYNPAYRKRATELNVYFDKFKTDVKASDIIKDGFKKEQIGKEIKRRELKYIDNFLSRKI